MKKFNQDYKITIGGDLNGKIDKQYPQDGKIQ